VVAVVRVVAPGDIRAVHQGLLALLLVVLLLVVLLLEVLLVGVSWWGRLYFLMLGSWYLLGQAFASAW
jgi:hypothetical protein